MGFFVSTNVHGVWSSNGNLCSSTKSISSYYHRLCRVCRTWDTFLGVPSVINPLPIWQKTNQLAYVAKRHVQCLPRLERGTLCRDTVLAAPRILSSGNTLNLQDASKEFMWCQWGSYHRFGSQRTSWRKSSAKRQKRTWTQAKVLAIFCQKVMDRSSPRMGTFLLSSSIHLLSKLRPLSQVCTCSHKETWVRWLVK